MEEAIAVPGPSQENLIVEVTDGIFQRQNKILGRKLI